MMTPKKALISLASMRNTKSSYFCTLRQATRELTGPASTSPVSKKSAVRRLQVWRLPREESPRPYGSEERWESEVQANTVRLRGRNRIFRGPARKSAADLNQILASANDARAHCAADATPAFFSRSALITSYCVYGMCKKSRYLITILTPISGGISEQVFGKRMYGFM